MKNILRILPFFLILTLSGCDFLKNDFFRALAGRPKACQVEQIKDKIAARRQAVADSIEAVRLVSLRREMERQDSISGAEMVQALAIKTSSVSSFGEPVRPVPFRYNAMVGVFRKQKSAEALFDKLTAKGYVPYYIYFEDDVRAVCLCGDNSFAMLAQMLSSASSHWDCPKGTWVYVRK